MEAEEIAAAVRTALAGATPVREVKMFGGIGFMLNGNMLVAASKRGLLARIGKGAQDDALSRPGVRPMEMRGRIMEGYVFVDPSALTKPSIAGWIRRARDFVETLPSKPAATRKKGKTK